MRRRTDEDWLGWQETHCQESRAFDSEQGDCNVSPMSLHQWRKSRMCKTQGNCVCRWRSSCTTLTISLLYIFCLRTKYMSDVSSLISLWVDNKIPFLRLFRDEATYTPSCKDENEWQKCDAIVLPSRVLSLSRNEEECKLMKVDLVSRSWEHLDRKWVRETRTKLIIS